MFVRVMMISLGTFLGGGYGFYLKETYYLKKKEKRCEELEIEWKELHKLHKEKEEMLK